MIFLLVATLLVSVTAQFTSQTYPDPRLDPFSCRVPFPGSVCDPTGVVKDDERSHLAQRISQLTGVTSSIKNTATACASRPQANLQIVVAIMEKIGLPSAAIDIEKFANNLKRKYQNYQDVGMCDTLVLIVNSKQDRQVFTVAGRDAKISKDTLKKAFESNIGHFKQSRYALGLEGMIEMITAAYSNAHIVQVPSPDVFPSGSVGTDFGTLPVETPAPFRAAAAGLPTQNVQLGNYEELIQEVPQDDRIWVDIMAAAMSRCGESGDFANSVRSVVEEAMAISVKLINDKRYNSIEEEVDSNEDILGIRDTAWQKAGRDWVTPLFNKYKQAIRAGSTQVCPAINPNRIVSQNGSFLSGFGL